MEALYIGKRGLKNRNSYEDSNLGILELQDRDVRQYATEKPKTN